MIKLTPSDIFACIYIYMVSRAVICPFNLEGHVIQSEVLKMRTKNEI